MQRVLVTGATGFIGRRLCAALKIRGAHVQALGRSGREGPWDAFVQADLAQGTPASVLHNVDTVFHLAGKAHALSETNQDAAEYFHINTEGAHRLLDAARAAGVRRFVFFSSVKAMGEGGDACLDESADCHPETPYGRSKLAAERLVLDGDFVREPIVLRLSMVYGPTLKGNLPKMIEAIRKGHFPPLPEMGNRRSMVSVDDVVQAATLAAERNIAIGQTYIVTDGQACSSRQVYEWICEALGKKIPNWKIPLPVFKGLAKIGDGVGCLRGRRFIFDSDALEKLTSSSWYCSDKIERELGFASNYRLRDSLPKIVHHLVQQ